MKLSRREKYSIYIVALFLSVFVFTQFLIFPFMDRKQNLKRSIRVKTQILKNMVALKSEYEEIIQKTDLSKSRVAERPKGFTLFSFLDRLAGATGLKDHIAYMKPSVVSEKNNPIKRSKVEMKLSGINMKQLTAYLHRVETSKNMLSVKRLSISKTGTKKEVIDVVLQVETFEI